MDAMISVYEHAIAEYIQLLATVGAKVKGTEDLASLSGLIISVTSARIEMEDKYKEVKLRLSELLAGNEQANLEWQTLERIVGTGVDIFCDENSTDPCVNVLRRQLNEAFDAAALAEESAIKSLQELGYADTTIRVLVPHSKCTGERLSPLLKDSAEAKSRL